METKKIFKDLGPIHQYGIFEIAMPLGEGITSGDIGIQLSSDGRIWICLNGQSIFRFKPLRKEEK